MNAEVNNKMVKVEFCGITDVGRKREKTERAPFRQMQKL